MTSQHLSYSNAGIGPSRNQLSGKSSNYDWLYVTREEVKHTELPLKSKWVIWEQIAPDSAGGKTTQYADQTNKVTDFRTVQDFWKLWNHLPQPSELLDQKRLVRETVHGVNVLDAIMIFKEGIRPEWEDPDNAKGGHFQYQLKSSVGGPQIDEYWNNIVIAMIGGEIEPYDMINGVRLVDKLNVPRQANGIRLEVWFKHFEDNKEVKRLQTNLEKLMSRHLDGSNGSTPKCELKGHQQKGWEGIFSSWKKLRSVLEQDRKCPRNWNIPYFLSYLIFTSTWIIDKKLILLYDNISSFRGDICFRYYKSLNVASDFWKSILLNSLDVDRTI